MAEGSHLHGGDSPSGSRDAALDGERPARTDYEVSQRARYLAKAASLGQVILDDDAPGSER
jgi:hypothetical protein